MTTELGPSSSVDTLEQTTPDTAFGDGDHERFAHYVLGDKIVESQVMGTPIVALCGKVWVPSRDPSRFPVCPECKEIYESIGARNDGPTDPPTG